ncbi:variable surface protein [Plasmodium gonderi]|uniref:Variable surface protein n=1 Tax=Plasmodium gonderi TaxID=77519 RepID=A0A1Y1JWG5_PLAGO|nr:variable surface protein [Plasmodium gonderi]GAW84194.1 variable surface protein [Plasmodium gonderi]
MMGDNIVPLKYNVMHASYGFLDDFSYWEEIMQMKENDNYGSYYNAYCSSIDYVFKGENKTEFIKEICPKSFSCFYDMLISKKNTNYREAGCRYFPYWLYYILKKHNCSNDTVQIYKTLMNTYLRYLPSASTFCTEYANKLTNEQLEDLISIYNTYKCIKKTETNYIPQNNNEYCITLKKIIDKYQESIIEEDHDMAQSRKSSIEGNIIQEIACSCRSNIINTIATTIILTSLILFFLLLVFKYTSYGPLLRHGIKSIRKKLYNIFNTRNIPKRTEVPINILNSGIYDMMYNQF